MVIVQIGGKGKSSSTVKGWQTGASKAGIVFSTSRTRSNLKKGRYAPRITKTAAVYLAAVLEYLVAEVGEISGTAAQQHNRRTISSRFITLAIANDEEIHRLCANVIIKDGGVAPHIEPALLPKPGKSHKRKRKSVKGAADDD